VSSIRSAAGGPPRAGRIELLNARPPGVRAGRTAFRCPVCGDVVLEADRSVHHAGDRYHAGCAQPLGRGES
jgi:hypothetical protein